MPTKKVPPDPHVFGRPRPLATKGFKLHFKAKRDTQFRELPPPTGEPPYALDLKDILPDADYKVIAKKKVTFHVNGDMGGINDAMPQTLVAKGMEQDFDPSQDASDNPAFLYILGDCVYFNGEVKEYYVPSSTNPTSTIRRPSSRSLGTTTARTYPPTRRCTDSSAISALPSPSRCPSRGDSGRTAMTQPNVYWSLETPS